MPVSDIGNHRVGEVGVAGVAAFKLDILSDGFTWLREDALFWVGAHAATLICADTGVGQYAA